MEAPKEEAELAEESKPAEEATPTAETSPAMGKPRTPYGLDRI